MKKFAIAAAAAALFSTTAFAADLGVISQPAPVGFEPANDWTGFYAGIFAGAGGGQSTLAVALPGLGGVDFAGNSFGGIAGIQVGADYQIGTLVVGAVADIAASSISVNNNFGAGGLVGFGYESRLNYLGTLRARAGFLPTDNLLAYVHGGFAYGQTSPQFTIAGGGLAPDLNSVNRTGYTVGAGVEYKVTENISVQTEYAYTNLGSPGVDYNAGGFPAGATITESTAFHTIKAGLNYRF